MSMWMYLAHVFYVCKDIQLLVTRHLLTYLVFSKDFQIPTTFVWINNR